MPHDRLLLRTAGASDFDPGHLIDVLGEQRQRFGDILRGFGPADWAAATRCTQWSAQDVVRHLCDVSAVAITAGPDDQTLDFTRGFDPRATPRRWLAATAGERPAVTLDRFLSTTGDLLAVARDRLAQGRSFDVRLPGGPIDWTVLILHIFWDSWIHERDVLLARDLSHATDGDAIAYSAAYGVFIAAAITAMLGGQAARTLTLSGDGGGVYQVDHEHGLVTLTVTRGSAAGPPAAEMADMLGGRAPAGARLSPVASFFNTQD